MKLIFAILLLVAASAQGQRPSPKSLLSRLIPSTQQGQGSAGLESARLEWQCEGNYDTADWELVFDGFCDCIDCSDEWTRARIAKEKSGYVPLKNEFAPQKTTGLDPKNSTCSGYSCSNYYNENNCIAWDFVYDDECDCYDCDDEVRTAEKSQEKKSRNIPKSTGFTAQKTPKTTGLNSKKKKPPPKPACDGYTCKNYENEKGCITWDWVYDNECDCFDCSDEARTAGKSQEKSRNIRQRTGFAVKKTPKTTGLNPQIKSRNIPKKTEFTAQKTPKTTGLNSKKKKPPPKPACDGFSCKNYYNEKGCIIWDWVYDNECDCLDCSDES